MIFRNRELQVIRIMIISFNFQRSALAYRNDSCDNGLSRINVGISTTSTTSRSTSKSSGGLYKGDEYLRSTSTSTSTNIPPVRYPKTGPLPAAYGYDADKMDGVGMYVTVCYFELYLNFCVFFCCCC